MFVTREWHFLLLLSSLRLSLKRTHLSVPACEKLSRCRYRNGMTVLLDMIIQLIFPIVAIHTTRNHAAENVGVSLVLLGMTFEFALAFERGFAFGTSVACWTDVSGAEGSGIVVDRRGRVWELDSRTRWVLKAACRELASMNMAAIDSAECTWVCVTSHKRSVKPVSRPLASINVAVIDPLGCALGAINWVGKPGTGNWPP